MSTTIVIILILLVILLSISGIAGTFLPVLPGPPLNWGALLICYLSFSPYVSSTLLWIMLILTVIAQIIDYIAPIWMTKAGGGSKAATTGSTVGLLLGLFYMPIGLIIGPAIGAFVGEMLSCQQIGRALWVALLSFLSFILTTGLKLILSLLMSFYAISAILQYFADYLSV